MFVQVVEEGRCVQECRNVSASRVLDPMDRPAAMRQVLPIGLSSTNGQRNGRISRTRFRP
eukprot:163627-Chlamydomonas_euryale.AAC.1